MTSSRRPPSIPDTAAAPRRVSTSSHPALRPRARARHGVAAGAFPRPQALHLTPDYTLQTKPVDACPALSTLPIDVVVLATAYKGNPLPGGSVEVLRTSLQRIQAYPEPGSCPGLYMIEKITSRMERRLE